MSAAIHNSPGFLPIKPIALSPKETIVQSPVGLTYDVLIKPPSATTKFVSVKPFSPKEPIGERMKKVEERKMTKIQDKNERRDEKYDRVKLTQRQIFETSQKQEQEIDEKLRLKLQTAQENYDNYISQRKDTCGRHVEQVKEIAATVCAQRELENKEIQKRLIDKLHAAHEAYSKHLNERKEKCAREVEKAKEIAAATKKDRGYPQPEEEEALRRDQLQG